MSAIDSLLSRHDVVVYDAESHACIVDAVRMHIGKRFAFAHNDIDSLEKCLVRAKRITDGTEGGILVITEGVFGMRGDQGKLKEICALKEQYGWGASFFYHYLSVVLYFLPLRFGFLYCFHKFIVAKFIVITAPPRLLA